MESSTAVIILNWKRPQNIGRLVRSVGEALPKAAIFIIDQAEAPERLTGRTDIPLERCWVRTRPNGGPGVRFRIAAELPFEYYLCIDDDTFLTVDQMRMLMARLYDDPSRAHGVIGQLFRPWREGLQRIRFNGGTDVSFLNCIYAFTRSRAVETLRLATTAGYSTWEDVLRTDDILLSSAGLSRVHDLGPIERCETSSAEGVAMVGAEGFREERHAFITQMAARGLLHMAPPKT